MKMNSLSNLLAHEIVDLYSAEEQIIDALPQMIGKAQNQELKKALQEHLKVTEQQKKRLEKVHKMLQEEDGSSDEKLGDTTCLGMKGLIEEGKKALKEEMEPEVMDAAIIASAQKIEHYEISGYGTAAAFARELRLTEIEKLLRQTLNEEYYADDTMTDLAVGNVNEAGEDINVRKLPAGRNNGTRKATTQRSSSRASASKASSNGSKSSSSRSTRTKKSASSAGRSKSTTSKTKNSGSSRSKSKSSKSGR
jgi:ferritin-like metal-binding protein YciE